MVLDFAGCRSTSSLLPRLDYRWKDRPIKVWIAAFWYLYDDPDDIVGVFSTKELAEAALVHRESEHRYADGTRVEEYTLDEEI